MQEMQLSQTIILHNLQHLFFGTPYHVSHTVSAPTTPAGATSQILSQLLAQQQPQQSQLTVSPFFSSNIYPNNQLIPTMPTMPMPIIAATSSSSLATFHPQYNPQSCQSLPPTPYQMPTLATGSQNFPLITSNISNSNNNNANNNANNTGNNNFPQPNNVISMQMPIQMSMSMPVPMSMSMPMSMQMAAMTNGMNINVVNDPGNNNTQRKHSNSIGNNITTIDIDNDMMTTTTTSSSTTMHPDIITLNVGGQIFTTTKSTLKKSPLFKEIFAIESRKGKKNSQKIENEK